MRALPFDLPDLIALVAVVDAGSYTQAAEHLAASKSALSRRVAALEYALGARLLVRDQRGARPTDAGHELYRTAVDVLARLEQVRDEAAAGLTQLAGPIRITAPLSFGVAHLAPALAAFGAAHPSVELDVRLDDRVVDLAAGGFDLALRIGRPPDPPLTARHLAPVRPHLVASPMYLARRGRPAAASDLAGHDVLEYALDDSHLWRHGFAEAVDPAQLVVRLRSDNGETLRAGAIAGLGLVILPDFLVREAVDAGALEVLLPGYPLADGGLYAVQAPGRPRVRRVRSLVDHLSSTFGPAPPWTLGIASSRDPSPS